MRRPLLSIVVPTYQRRRILSATLPSLLNQHVPGAEYEVIVVVDGSRDGTLEMLREARWGARLRVIAQANQGQASARNRGVSEAQGDIILFLDDDMVAAPNLISVHLDEHGSSRERVVLGQMGLAEGVRRSYLKEGVEAWGKAFADRVTAADYQFRYDDWHSGHASIARSLFVDAGGFDRDFISYGNEDYELGWRLIHRGAKMRFAAHAVALQIYDKSFPAWLRDVYSVGRADVVLSEKHPSIAAGLRLFGLERHPMKRLARWSGLAALDPLAGAWAAGTGLMTAAEWLACRSAILSHGQSLLGERAYWRGVRDARRTLIRRGAGVLKQPGRAA